ncbi:hypothetical protein [Sphingomonas zeae]|jgi:hypothetical protein|uniref:hypothetical protein n=1 Tax=Sphingomonas zeae TaxID=1646122 RepID=UPI0039E822A2
MIKSLMPDAPIKTDIDQRPFQSRRISGPLMLGLLTVPLVFGWFLARRGYGNSTRIIVSVYASLGLAGSILSSLG